MAVYGIAKRTPGLVGQMVAEYEAGKNGTTTPAAQVVKDGLASQGVDAVDSGRPARDFLTNSWRNWWTDRDRDRQAGRAQREANADRSAWQKLQDRLDDRIHDRVQSWTKDTTGERPPVTDTDPAAGSADTDANKDGDVGPELGPAPELVDVVHDDDKTYEYPADSSDPGGEPTTTGEDAAPEPAREPIRVDVTVGEPLTEPKAWAPPTPIGNRPARPSPQPLPGGAATAVLEHEPEGEPMSNSVATTGGAVTGVISGSAEAAGIHRQLEAATQAYVAQIAAVRNRINRLGEQTLGVVQFAGASAVVVRMSQAAEAAAAAEANARQCATEVGPLLLATKREFDRRNS